MVSQAAITRGEQFMVHPSKVALDDGVLGPHTTHLVTRMNPCVVFTAPPTPTDDMFHSFHITESHGNVPSVGMVVGQHAAHAENGIEAFKYFSGEEGGWAKSTNIANDMQQYMDFGLDNDPSWVDQCPYVQHVGN
jgi:hypothetical protein